MLSGADLREIFGYLFDVGVDVLGTTVDAVTNVITAQTGNSTTGEAEPKTNEWWQHAGFASRPAQASNGAASCQVLKLKKNDRDINFASRDVRGTKIYGNLKDGETCVYASSGAARTIYKKNGAIVHYTTNDNTDTGTSVVAYIGPDKIQLSNQYGSLTIGPDGITIATADGSSGLLLKPGQATLAGTQVAVNGSLVAVAGSVATCLGADAVPVPLTSTALKGPGGSAGACTAAPCTTVFMGK